MPAIFASWAFVSFAFVMTAPMVVFAAMPGFAAAYPAYRMSELLRKLHLS